MNNSLLPFLWFLAILCLIPLALWLLKRSPMGGFGGTGGGGMLRVVSTLPISPNQRLQIVEVGQGEDRQWLVLGITGQQIHTLHVMPPQAEPASGAQQASFAQLLASKLKGEQRAS